MATGWADDPAKPEAVIQRLRERCLTILDHASNHLNAFVRSGAIRAAGESRDPELIDLIRRGARDVYPTSRLFALQAMQKVSKEETRSLAEKLINDPDVWVQGTALELLGESGGSAVRPLLLPFLEQDDVAVRLAASAALYQLGDVEQFDLIADYLKEGNPTYRFQAIGLMGKIGSYRAVSQLLPLLDDPDEQVIYYSLKALGDYPPKEVLERLKTLSHHSNSTIRYQSVWVMGFLEAAQDELRPFCNDEDAMVRLAAAVSMSRFHMKPCEGIYDDLLSHPDYGVRSAFARVLGTAPIPNRIDLLARALKDRHSRVRTAAVRAVGMAGGAEAFFLLIHMLDDSLPVVQAYAAGNLIHIMND